ncbi:MAG: DUF6090 family protein [Polaribacter sp.]
MIQIFKKIRRKLLENNRLRSYSIYALGEVFLVVIGILLALQFNNWNVERSNNERERWYLINIVEDIEYQKGDLKDLQSDYKISIEIAQGILKDFKRLGSFSKIDSLNEKISDMLVADNFPNINNTDQELVNSGQQTLIKNKDLSIDVIDYYLFCNDNYIDVKNNNDNIFYEDIYPTFSALHQTNLLGIDLEDNSLDFEDENTNIYIKRKLEDPENVLSMLNALRKYILINTFHLEMVEKTLKISLELDNPQTLSVLLGISNLISKTYFWTLKNT